VPRAENTTGIRISREIKTAAKIPAYINLVDAL
jgi:hypothetical protein